MKKIVSVTMAAAMLLGLTACGGKAGSTAVSSSTAGAASQSAAEGEKVTLNFWDMNWNSAAGDMYVNAAKAKVDEFNASQDHIVVEYQSIPWADYYQYFLTAIKGGAGPDVATAGSQTPIQFYQMGEILPLDDIVEQWKTEGTYEDYIAGIVESNYYDGHYIALPWGCDPRTIIYRTDLFEEAGITELPTNWEELKAALETLKEKFPDKVPLAAFGNLQGAQQVFDYFLHTNEGGQVTEDLKADFNNPKMQETLEYVASLYDGGLIPEGMIAYEQTDAERLFLSGEACCMIPASTSALLDDNLKDKVGILNPIQGPSATEPRTLYWANSIAAYAQTKYPEESKQFIKWWLENQESLFVDGLLSAVPARISFMENPYFSENVLIKSYTEVIYPTFLHATYPVPGFYPAYGQINGERYLGEAGQKILSGERDYNAIMDATQVKIQEALDAVS
ncbi:MAG: sugar ABC transporter substrate-binding protein [Gemmiger sp.]|nr:sugar ABC transporter substrate-binding protein [Gemmiger sp.]